jgi:uncharacterized protein YndB with AHSA1/START domain
MATTTSTGLNLPGNGGLDNPTAFAQALGMTVLNRELDIDLPPEVVFEQLLDVAAWPRWMVGVQEAGSLGRAPALGGKLFFVHVHNQRTPRVEVEITELRPNKSLAYRPCGGDEPYTEGMTHIEWEWRLFRRPLGGTRLRFTLTYEAAGGIPFFQELIGTRMQVLNTAESWLQALRSLGSGETASEVAEA